MAKFLVTVKHKNNPPITKEVIAGCSVGATQKAYEAYGYNINSKVRDIVVSNVRKID